MISMDSILEMLSNVKGSDKGGYTALCPAHDDQNNSLSINKSEDGKILMHCFAGCSNKVICESLGIKESDLFPARKYTREPQVIDKSYRYVDENGNLTYEVCRLSPKAFKQRRPDGNGGWIWNLKGVKPVLYNLPQVLKAVDSGTRIYMVEGEKDADVLTNQGLVATTISGGALKQLTPELYKGFYGASEVVIIPDNDDAGRKYAKNWLLQLKSHVERISIVEIKDVWPDIPKNGDISDYLEHCRKIGILPEKGLPHELDELTLFTGANDKEPLLLSHADIVNQVEGYAHINGRINRVKDGINLPLLTGSIVLRRQIMYDEVTEATMMFEVEGITDRNENLGIICVPADKFPSMTWVANAWGAKLNILPGKTNKDYLNFIIMETGRIAGQCSTVYGYHGFRIINGKPVYLYHGGSVGGEDLQVVLENAVLQRYTMPKGDEIDLKSAIEASKRTLGAHEITVTVPMFCFIYLAPLQYILREKSIESSFLLFLIGPTQSGKSTIAAIMMSHFGHFTRNSPTGSFAGTINSLRRMMHVIGDAPVWIDDYHPQASLQERRRMDNMVQSLLRSAGDRADRSRLSAEMKLREGQPPRSIGLVTGEDQPDVGQSGIGRMFAVDVKKLKTPPDIRQSQKDAKEGLLKQAMRGYIEFIVKNWDSLNDAIPRKYYEYLENLSNKLGTYGRQVESAAALMLGAWMFSEYAKDAGVFDEMQSDSFCSITSSQIIELVKGQEKRLETDKPTTIFIDSIRDLMQRGKLFEDISNGCMALSEELEPTQIGWKDPENYYLNGGLAYASVSRFLKDQGREFPVSKNEIIKRLASEGYTIRGSDGRGVIKKRIGSKTLNLICIPRKFLDEYESI